MGEPGGKSEQQVWNKPNGKLEVTTEVVCQTLSVWLRSLFREIMQLSDLTREGCDELKFKDKSVNKFKTRGYSQVRVLRKDFSVVKDSEFYCKENSGYLYKNSELI